MRILACHRLQTRTPRPPDVGPGPALQPCPGPNSRDGPQGHPLHPSLFSRGDRQEGSRAHPAFTLGTWRPRGSLACGPELAKVNGTPGHEQKPPAQGQSFTKSLEARRWETPVQWGRPCTLATRPPTPHTSWPGGPSRPGVATWLHLLGTSPGFLCGAGTRTQAPRRGGRACHPPDRPAMGPVHGPAALPRVGPLVKDTRHPLLKSLEKNLIFLIKEKQTGIYGCTCFWVCKDSRPVWHLCLARKWLHFFPQEHAVSIKFSRASCTIAKATDQDADILGTPSHCLSPQTHTGAYWGPTSLPPLLPAVCLGSLGCT